MSNKNELFSQSELETFYKASFTKLINGNTVNIVTYPGSGKKTKIKWIIDNEELFTNNKDKKLYLLIDDISIEKDFPNGIASAFNFALTRETKYKEEVIQLINNFIKDISINTFQQLLSDLTEEGISIILIIENFEQHLIDNIFSFFNTLETFLSSPKFNVSAMFITAKDIFSKEVRVKDRMMSVLTKEIIPEKDYPFSKTDKEISIKNFCKRLNIKPSKKDLDVANDITAKDASLIKEVCSILKETPKGFNEVKPNDYKTIYKLIGEEHLDKKYKRILSMLSFLEVMSIKKNVFIENGFLSKLGLVDREKKVIINPLFKHYIQKRYLIVDNNIEKLLTGTEKLVLERLVRDINKLVPRDDIADVLWGDKWATKYSDYTIDKFMSNIRKKVLNKYVIETVKGSGYICREK